MSFEIGKSGIGNAWGNLFLNKENYGDTPTREISGGGVRGELGVYHEYRLVSRCLAKKVR